MILILSALAIISAVIIAIYKYNIHQSDNMLKLELREAENSWYEEAWQMYYDKQSTKGKKQMNQVYIEALKRKAQPQEEELNTTKDPKEEK